MTGGPKDVGDIEDARRKRAVVELTDALVEDLGAPPVNVMAAIVGAAPETIRVALVEGLQRNEIYAELDRQHALRDEAEGLPADRCCNMVCSRFCQNEGWKEVEAVDGHRHLVPVSDRKNFCEGGFKVAQQCMFRMTDPPPSDPFTRLPSWAEAVRMLQRAGLLQPDEFGHYNGTDFAFHGSTQKLWWAYVGLLVSTGRIASFPVESDDVSARLDRGAQSDAAREVLLGVTKAKP
jgi:hypothetical protein